MLTQKQADKNLDFFLGHLSNTHGEGGKVWEGESSNVANFDETEDRANIGIENRHHNVANRTKKQLEAYYFTA